MGVDHEAYQFTRAYHARGVRQKLTSPAIVSVELAIVERDREGHPAHQRFGERGGALGFVGGGSGGQLSAGPVPSLSAVQSAVPPAPVLLAATPAKDCAIALVIPTPMSVACFAGFTIAFAVPIPAMNRIGSPWRIPPSSLTRLGR